MTSHEIVRLRTEAAEQLRSILAGFEPRVGLILGSGLSPERLPLKEVREIATAGIPHLPQPTVAGHRGLWIAASLETVPVLIADGRSHGYEGLALNRATLGVRMMRAVGCQSLVVTNAAGGIREDLTPGSLMAIRDHVNLLGRSPLVGPHDDALGQRFPDMTEAYDGAWRAAGKAAAEQLGIDLAEGVYAACLGPQYETPAEIRMLRAIGADAVGMSTVPEVIVARQEGLRVFGLSLISNAAAGISPHPLSHKEVVEAGEAAADKLSKLLSAIVRGSR